VTIFAADDPMGDCEGLEGSFLERFPLSRSEFRSSTSLSFIPTAGGAASVAPIQPRIEAARGGATNHDRKGVNRGSTSMVTSTMRRCDRFMTVGF